jgi:hypothetical protein
MMNENRAIFIPVILGTPRQGRFSEHVARFVFGEVAKLEAVETVLIDIRDIPLSTLDAGEAIKDAGFSETVMRADALIIIAPQLGGVVQEVHSCRGCGKTAMRTLGAHPGDAGSASPIIVSAYLRKQAGRMPALPGKDSNMTKEEIRLEQSLERRAHWKRWGPYLSERAWGTVREDYSPYGTAWDFLPHDHARSKAYRWGEDGIGGISDRHQLICFAVALWNGRDPILKERIFGLTGSEGNHGEDVKEYYFYLDSTPTHSYMKYLYKYPQAEFPYARLVEENRRRGKDAPEFELMDTGVFDEDRYFDVEIEYAKATPEDILIRINVTNRGPEYADLHLLPTIWFRNTWSWRNGEVRPSLRQINDVRNATAIQLCQPAYGHRWLFCNGMPELLFTENETNTRRLYNYENGTRHAKDGINDYIVHGKGCRECRKERH